MKTILWRQLNCKVGDNDNLAASVATVVDADALIICSDVDGLYTANPRADSNALLIPEVHQITPGDLCHGWCQLIMPLAQGA